MKKIIFITVSSMFIGVANGQHLSSEIPAIRLIANDQTPEGVVGERRISSTFSLRWLTPHIGTLSQPRLRTATLFCSRDSTALGEADLARLITNVEERNRLKISLKTRLTTARTVAISFPHGRNLFEWRWAADEPYFATEERVYYRWRVKFADRKTYATTVRSFTVPRPLTIAIIGDSYMSGEGAPSVSGSRWINGGENCHRSTNSGAFKAVQAFAERHTNIQVVYQNYFVACSGAHIHHLLTKSMPAGFCDSLAGRGSALPQITQLSQLTQKYCKVDALVLGVGTNDVGFKNAVEYAFAGHLSDHISGFAQNIRSPIPRVYNALVKHITQDLCIDHVYAVEYPDPTRDETGNTCGLSTDIGNFLLLAIQQATIGAIGDLADETAQAVCKGTEGLANFFIPNSVNLPCNELDVFSSHPREREELLKYINKVLSNPDDLEAITRLEATGAMPSGVADQLRTEQGRTEFFVDMFFRVLSTLIDHRPLTTRDIQTIFGTRYCSPAADGRISSSSLFSTLFGTQTDYKIARDSLIIPLNNEIQRQCASPDAAGKWHFVSGVATATRRKGLCCGLAGQRQFNSVMASLQQQGTTDGTVHPNSRGHNVSVKAKIFDSLNADLASLENRRSAPYQSCKSLGETCTATFTPYDTYQADIDEMEVNGEFKFWQLLTEEVNKFVNTYGDDIKVIVDRFPRKKFINRLRGK